MTGTYFLWWWDPGHCVGELVVIGGVTGTYFLWWWDPGHCACRDLELLLTCL